MKYYSCVYNTHFLAVYEPKYLDLKKIGVLRIDIETGKINLCVIFDDFNWPHKDYKKTNRISFTQGNDFIEHALRGYERYCLDYEYKEKLNIKDKEGW